MGWKVKGGKEDIKSIFTPTVCGAVREYVLLGKNNGVCGQQAVLGGIQRSIVLPSAVPRGSGGTPLRRRGGGGLGGFQSGSFFETQ